MSAAPYVRYVAIGDSTTEGLEDRYPDGGFRGWADRLAERLDELGADVRYANLAIRGRKVARISDEQLEPALAMAPDLASVVGGINDILRPKVDLDHVAGQIERMVAALRAGGATVLMMTYPDPANVMRVARGTSHRVLAFDDALREIAARRGARLVDLAHAGTADARLLHPDRLHANSEGHRRIAEAAAETLELPGVTAGWRDPLPSAERAPISVVVAREAAWTARYLVPWVGRRLRGRSSGDGVAPKRPQLMPVHPG
ncbi:MAG: SGNH/GDSL hydrolase family protein [Solirubrobacteraceae bacterium]